MRPLLVFLAFIILVHTSISIQYAYITSTGTSNAVCSKIFPCGHFKHALNNVVNDEEIVIRIYGMNPTYDTYCNIQISGNVTFIFDTTQISTTNDWFGTVTNCDYYSWAVLGIFGLIEYEYPLEISADANVKFYGLIWDAAILYNDMSGSGIEGAAISSWSGSTIFCENCIFRDSQMELRSKKVDFHNALFDNFVMTWFGGDPRFRQSEYGGTTYRGPYILTHDLELNIINSTIQNIADTNFVKIASDLQWKNTINVYNSSILASTTFLYVENSWTYSFVTNKIHFESVRFIGSDTNTLTALYVEPWTLIDITMNQITVSYSQYIPQAVTGANLADNEVIHIGSSHAKIDISNSIITTIIHCSVDCLIVSTGRRIRRLAIACDEPPLPWCNSNYPFLFNNGMANLNNVSIKSDFNSAVWEQYFFHTTLQYDNSGINYLPTEKHDFSLSNTAWDNEPYFTAIFNDYDGVMDVFNLNADTGAHFSILFNRNGIVNIDGMTTQYENNNGSMYYDRWNLMFHTIISNSFGELTIRNSIISAADKSLINIYAGNIYIHNVTLSQSMLPIITLYSAERIYLNNVNIFEVGSYYATLGAAVYYSGSSGSGYGEYVDFYHVVNVIAPIYLSGNEIIVKNCLFYYISPYGIIKIGRSGVYASRNDNRSTSNLVMIGNIFADKTELFSYKGYHYFTDFSYLSQLTTEYYGAAVDIAAVQVFVANMLEGGNSMKGLVFIGDQYYVVYGGNLFHLTNPNIVNASVKNVYIDTNTHSNCIAGNTFYNVDLYVNSGDIISCKHSQINIYGQACMRHLGAMNNSFKTSYFTNASIIIGSMTKTMIIDDTIFHNSNNSIKTINNQFGFENLIFLDSMFSDNNEISNILDDCNIICHEIIDNNSSEIRQLNAKCNTNSSNFTNSQFNSEPKSLNFWTPHYLILNPSDNGKTSISPGQSLQIEYTITDYYGNIVNKSYYPGNISILLRNQQIPVVSVLDINNGICTACESGIDLSSLTMHDVNNSFIISTQVTDNSLITNDINIQITECIEGYGISDKTLQCEECIEGRYTLQSNLQQCHICNQEIDYIDCPGSNIIIAEYNHWIDVTVKINPDFNNYSSQIISSDCPNGYCCQLIDGCDYLLDYDELCALNRHVTTPLCGKCNYEYSELLGTSNCGICDRTRYEYFLLPLFIAILFSIYLLYFDVPRDEKDKTTPNNNKKLKKQQPQTAMVFKDDQRALTVMIFKVLLYFAQGLTFVLLASTNIHDGLMFYLLPILQIFNLSIQFGMNSSKEEAGYCLIKGMTALTEILLNLTIPVFIAILIALSWIFNKCCGCKLQCCCFKNRNVSYISAMLRGLLIVIGSVLGVIFQILTCRNIENDLTVHFYYGSHECYDLLWVVCGLVLAVIFIVWCILDIRLWRMKDNRQKRIENNLWIMISSYKHDLWYWETILLSRRTFLALFTIINESSNILNDILAALLGVYFGLQLWKQPFKYKRVNRLESCCILILLFVVIFVNGDVFKKDNGSTTIILGLFLLICILLPILIVLYEIIRTFKHLCCKKQLTEREAVKIEMRRPTNNPQLVMNYSDQYETECLKLEK
eukprot:367489_1